MAQTVIQDSKSIRAGDSIKLELDAGSGYVDVGAIKGDVTMNILADTTQTKDVNVSPLDRKFRNQRGEITINSLELNTANWNLFLSGMSSLSTVAATPVAGASTDVTFTEFLSPLEFAVQNSDGSVLTVNSASGSVDGALVEGTDYVQVIKENGKVAVYLIDSATVTTAAQTVTFNVDYTPAASSRIDFGSSISTATPLQARVTFRDYPNAQTIGAVWYKVYNTNGLPMTFVSRVTTEEMTVNVTFEASIDATKDDGKQLGYYEIVEGTA